MAELAMANASNPEHDHLLYELETSDTSSVGLVLRAIYDGDEHQKFMEKLDARIKNHDKDIERMCNFHYQGFIDSFSELLKVRPNAVKLKEDIVKIEDDMQASITLLLHKSEELIKCRKVQSNIAATIECLSLCLPVLETYAKLKRQMKEKRYYPALKTLEQLEQTYLPRVTNYRFSQQMRENIPKLRECIKESSMSDLKDFLESIRKHSPKIGEVAMRHAAEQNNMEYVNAPRKKKRKAPPPPNPFTGEVDSVSETSSITDIEENLSAQDLVDFSPVYRCLHIYTAMGLRETFESYYRKQRRKQARLALQPPTDMHQSFDGFKQYFQGVVGFFVVEDHILNTADGLVNRAYLDEVWDMAISTTVASLSNQSTYCCDPNVMLKLKNMVMLFSYTLRDYGYQVTRLSDLLVEVRNQYNSILMQQWGKVFTEIFYEDNYQAVQVKNQEEYDSIIKMFPYTDEVLEKLPFPKRFPFSQFVPKIFSQVKDYILACLKFSEDLNLSQTEADEMVRKATNLLLTKTLSECLSALIKRPTLGVLQLIQINVNINYLEEANMYLEEFISSITGSSEGSSHVAKLQAKSMFRVGRVDAEAQIYQQLRQKIDDSIELANYDWLMPEPTGQASSYMTDLMTFLRNTFQNLVSLPGKVAQTACITACKHIATSLMNMITNRELQQVSMGVVQQFNLDVIQCEAFASSNPVDGFEQEDDLIMCFADLRQLLDLFMTWDWSTYFHEYGQDSSRYLRVSPHTAISLLEKMREADKKNVFAVLRKSERDKKKLLDTVLKQLRHLTTNGTT